MLDADITQIIQRAKQGDKQAIAQLYERYVQQIFRYIAYRVSTSSDVEDLTAEVFVKMVEGLPRYHYRGVPFEAWLYRIAAARIVDYRRRNRRRPQAELYETLHDTNPLPEERMQNQQEFETLRHAVANLTDEQQSVLILRFIEHKSHHEVAQILGKSVSAVKSIQHRALTNLTAQLGSETKVRHYLRGGSHGEETL